MRIIIILLLLTCQLHAQVIYPYRTTTSPKELHEFSGIAKLEGNLLAGINDSGNLPIVYFLDTLGKLRSSVTLTGCKNNDWEELFYENGLLYISDLGDNSHVRSKGEIIVYHYKDKEVRQTINVEFKEKQNLPLPESKRDFDCEAGFIREGKINLFTKTHSSPYTGKSYHYIAKDGEKISWTDSASFGKRGFINSSLTGAAISPDKKLVAFISCTHLWIHYLQNNTEDYFGGIVFDFDFDAISQKEAITFLDNSRFIVADERFKGTAGGRMYYFNIRQFLTGRIKYFKPWVKSAFLSVTSKPGTLELEMELTKKTDSLTLVIVDKNATILHQEKIKVLKNNFEQKITMKMGKLKNRDLVGFWLVENNQVIYSSKVSSTW